RAPACATLASRAIAANSQRCVRIMEGGPRNGWRKSAKRQLHKHFAHPVQGTTEATAGGRALASRGREGRPGPDRQWALDLADEPARTAGRGRGRALASCGHSASSRSPRPKGRFIPLKPPYLGGGGASTERSPLCSGADTTPAASIASTRRAARL